MGEYLVWRPEGIDDEHEVREMLRYKCIYSAERLAEKLDTAMKFLTETPGPNQENRGVLAAGWLGWWKNHLKNHDDRGYATIGGCGRIMEFDEISSYLERQVDHGKSSGGLFMATGEGTPGHRKAWEQMNMNVLYPFSLFENRQYFVNHPHRREPFLPLSIRLALAVYHSQHMHVSVIPDNDNQLNEPDFYRSQFAKTGITYSFGTEGEPGLEEKLMRGKPAAFILIPNDPSPRTSEHTRKLMADTDEDEIWKAWRQIDPGRKFMGVDIRPII